MSYRRTGIRLLTAAVLLFLTVNGLQADSNLARAQYRLGMKLFSRGAYLNAALEFQRLLGFNSWSFSQELRRHTRLLEALSWYRAGNSTLAMNRFASLKNDARVPARLRSAALYYYARTLADLKRFNNALYYYLQMVRSYPTHPLADDAQYDIAVLWLNAGDKKRADVEFKRVVDDYPTGSHAEAARLQRKLLAADTVKLPLQNINTNQGVRYVYLNITNTVTNTVTNYIKTAVDKPAQSGESAILKKQLQQKQQQLTDRQKKLDGQQQQLKKERSRLKTLELLLQVKQKNLEAYLKVLRVKEAALRRKEKELKRLENQ